MDGITTIASITIGITEDGTIVRQEVVRQPNLNLNSKQQQDLLNCLTDFQEKVKGIGGIKN